MKRLDESLSKELLLKIITGQPGIAPDPDRVLVTPEGHLVPDSEGFQEPESYQASCPPHCAGGCDNCDLDRVCRLCGGGPVCIGDLCDHCQKEENDRLGWPFS